MESYKREVKIPHEGMDSPLAGAGGTDENINETLMNLKQNKMKHFEGLSEGSKIPFQNIYLWLSERFMFSQIFEKFGLVICR